jgi:hypothetical protein
MNYPWFVPARTPHLRYERRPGRVCAAALLQRDGHEMIIIVGKWPTPVLFPIQC